VAVSVSVVTTPLNVLVSVLTTLPVPVTVSSVSTVLSDVSVLVALDAVRTAPVESGAVASQLFKLLEKVAAHDSALSKAPLVKLKSRKEV
jgi:hypothetical protein